MLNIKALILLLCLSTLHSVPSYALNQCTRLFQGNSPAIYIATPNSIIGTPESLPTVKKTMGTLKSLARHAQTKKDYRGQIYRQVLPELNETLQLGQQIMNNKASDQNQVFEFFMRSVVLIDHGITVGNKVGYIADGFAGMDTFTNEGFKERFQELHRGRDLSDVSFDNFLAKNKSALTPRFQLGLGLNSSFQFISIEGERLPDSLQFTFQYKYVFKEGTLTLLDLFKDRENGTTYLGISQKEKADYDGQHGDAVSFLRHDLVHSYTQKYFDKKLFDEFNTTSLEQMTQLKSKTNELLQTRIKEYQSIDDPTLKDAIEAWFFIFLHEQSRSYPIGVEHDFKSPNSLEFYRRSIPIALRAGRLGEELKYLEAHPQKIAEALEWLGSRALEDSKNLRSQY